MRQHWKLLVTFIAFVAICATIFGAVRIRPYVTGDPTVLASKITDNITGTVDLFDTSIDHQMSIDISDAEYSDMLTAYQDNGEKKWATADITIDGTFINDAAVRLKGNSTLMGLRKNGFKPPQRPSGMPGGAGVHFDMPAVSADDPTSLPLLISLEENAAGRAYQSLTELSVRPGSPGLNESVALSLTAATGQPTQRFTYAVYSINGSATTTRLLLEHPGELYAAATFDSDGFLYKADASSTLKYVGDDQSKYVEQFKQLNAVGAGDLQPIIRFVKWMDSADDTQFAAHLDKWVNVHSLADYIATQHLIANGDDMAGPGQNYYLWYDSDSQRLSVVSWDLNLAMMGSADTGPDDPIEMGFPGHDKIDPNQQAPAAAHTAEASGGSQQPDAAEPPGPHRLKGNNLKTRFEKAPAFRDMYHDAYWTLYEQMYGNGSAFDILDTIAARIPLSDGLSSEQLRSAVEKTHTWIEQRTTALAKLRNG